MTQTIQRIDDALNANAEPEHVPGKLRAFTLRDVPWAQLGAVLDGEALTAEQAAHAGGLDFEVDLVEAGYPYGSPRRWRAVPHQRAVVRADTGQFMAFVSDTYQRVQYHEAFEFMDTIDPRYVAAGTLSDGRQAFMVVELPQIASLNFRVAGRVDQHQLYVVLRTSHDRTKALEASVLNLRGKCMNALALASFTRNAPQRWAVRHVGDPVAKLRAATATLRHVESYADEFKRQARLLADVKIDVAEAREILCRLLPDRPRRDDTVNAIVAAWQHSPTNGFTDNGWGLTNAVSEYFEWGRSDGLRTAQSRFTSGLNGPTYRYVNRTAQLLLRRR